MKWRDLLGRPNGLYRIFWGWEGSSGGGVQKGGGSSLGVIGGMYSDDRWCACANWKLDKSKPNDYLGVLGFGEQFWDKVDRIELVRDEGLQTVIDNARPMAWSVKQPLDAERLALIRDTLLAGSDVDALALLCQELGIFEITWNPYTMNLISAAYAVVDNGFGTVNRTTLAARLGDAVADHRKQRDQQTFDYSEQAWRGLSDERRLALIKGTCARCGRIKLSSGRPACDCKVDHGTR